MIYEAQRVAQTKDTEKHARHTLDFPAAALPSAKQYTGFFILSVCTTAIISDSVQLHWTNTKRQKHKVNNNVINMAVT